MKPSDGTRTSRAGRRRRRRRRPDRRGTDSPRSASPTSPEVGRRGRSSPDGRGCPPEGPYPAVRPAPSRSPLRAPAAGAHGSRRGRHSGQRATHRFELTRAWHPAARRAAPRPPRQGSPPVTARRRRPARPRAGCPARPGRPRRRRGRTRAASPCSGMPVSRSQPRIEVVLTLHPLQAALLVPSLPFQ